MEPLSLVVLLRIAVLAFSEPLRMVSSGARAFEPVAAVSRHPAV